ncbi:EAL domain-containing protein [Endothiovibrio diazotrophicus]
MIDRESLRLLTHDLSVVLVTAEPGERERIGGMVADLFGGLREAADGPEALALLRERPADLVLADVALPGMDGLALARELLDRRPEQVVVLITPPHDPQLLGEVSKSGVAGFVFKPVAREQLAAALYQGAERVRERRALAVDPLTGLYNRRRFEERLGRVGRQPVVLLNLDNLPAINRALGFERGSEALRETARLLRRECPGECDLYRLSAGEFALAFPGAGLTWVERFAHHLHGLFSTTELALGEGLAARPKVTLAVVEAQGPEGVNLARNALMAAHERGDGVRMAGGDCPVTSDQDDTVAWIGRLREALAAGRVVPWFQPIVRNDGSGVTKYECLARVVEEGRVFDPARFIAPARLGGLIPDLTRVMVERSMAAFSGTPYSFSLNLSEEDLHDRRFAERMLGHAARFDIQPRRVIFEVLEEASVERDGSVPEQITRLRELGFRIAIDDFGAEHSNFARLLDLEADFIKIDGRFVQGLDHNPRGYAICRAITQLAHEIGARVVAEHVHNQAVFEAVKRLGIDYSQGYLFGQPVPAVLGKHF